MENVSLKRLIKNKSGRPKLLSIADIPVYTKKTELVIAYGIDFTFDYAIPQDWAGVAMEICVLDSKLENAWWNVIWAYDEKSGGWGRPFPLTLEALDVIKKTNAKLGWQIPKDSDFDFYFVDRPVLYFIE